MEMVKISLKEADEISSVILLGHSKKGITHFEFLFFMLTRDT